MLSLDSIKPVSDSVVCLHLGELIYPITVGKEALCHAHEIRASRDEGIKQKDQFLRPEYLVVGTWTREGWYEPLMTEYYFWKES